MGYTVSVTVSCRPIVEYTPVLSHGSCTVHGSLTTDESNELSLEGPGLEEWSEYERSCDLTLVLQIKMRVETVGERHPGTYRLEGPGGRGVDILPLLVWEECPDDPSVGLSVRYPRETYDICSPSFDGPCLGRTVKHLFQNNLT